MPAAKLTGIGWRSRRRRGPVSARPRGLPRDRPPRASGRLDRMQRRGQLLGLVARYWPYAGYRRNSPLRRGRCYGVPAAVARAALPDRCVVSVAGDGDFLMKRHERRPPAQYGCDLIVIVITQGRTAPSASPGANLSRPDRLDRPRQSRFRRLRPSLRRLVENDRDDRRIAEALAEAEARKGIRLLHCVVDIDNISAAGRTVSGLGAKP